MNILSAFIVGLIFGFGLILSGMTDPSKVLGFLDVTGVWDPSLGLVMGGAILVSSVAFFLASRRTRAVFGEQMRLPTATQIDRRLVLGGLAFGAGWGLAGYCPGPAVASLFTGMVEPVIFLAAMLIGMAVYEVHSRMSTNSGR